MKRTRLIPITAALVMTACGDAPISWEQPVALARAVGPTDRIAVDSAGTIAVASRDLPSAPSAPGQCRESVRMARDTTGEWYAAWWSTRADSTAEIVVARSPDGAEWTAPVRVDTVDAGRTGCRRVPPAIDAWGGHVHVAYSMAAREGPGIFASHSMDRGALFHTPVAVVYGERIGAVDIAARGNSVAIVFEDPNSTRDQIGLAWSNTMAHLFQHRETVTPAGSAARAPRITLGPDRLAVAWVHQPGGGTPSWLGRVGTIR